MKRLLFILFPLAVLWTSCSKEESFESGANAAGLATGTLTDTLGNCQPITIKGSYKVDSTLNDSNYITVQVNVTSTGQYKISTDIVNGFSFRDSGVFTSTGIFIVKLKGTGKPILPTNSSFEVRFGTAACLFSIPVSGTVSGGGVNGADTAWQFDETTLHFNGMVDSAAVRNVSGVNILGIAGSTKATGDSSLFITVIMPSNTVTPGTYSTTNGMVTFTFTNATGSPIYQGNQSNGSALTLIISSYDPNTKVLEATFSGTVKDAANTSKSLSSGRLKLQVL